MVEDPLKRLERKMKNNERIFAIKTINCKTLKTIFKKLKKKKSAGYDGLSQAQLAAGAPTLTEPLLNIFNSSISQGSFPSAWKEAIVTPVLKKGDKTMKENYRPISCLPAAAKLLEIVVWDQTSKYISIKLFKNFDE